MSLSDIEHRRTALPYGKAFASSGEWMFNRRYEALTFRSSAGAAWQPCEARECVPFGLARIWFYRDAHSERTKVALASASSNWA
jgi:hypothetical protein